MRFKRVKELNCQENKIFTDGQFKILWQHAIYKNYNINNFLAIRDIDYFITILCYKES